MHFPPAGELWWILRVVAAGAKLLCARNNPTGGCKSSQVKGRKNWAISISGLWSLQTNPTARDTVVLKESSDDVLGTPMATGLAARLAYAQLEQRRVDPVPLLARSRLSADSVFDQTRISALSQIKFLEGVSKATGDQWIGLTIAEKFDLRELGMLYYVAASSHQLGDGLARLERYVRVANEAVVIKLNKGRFYRVGFSYAGVSRHLDRHQTELFALTLVRLCRHLAGRKLVPASARFVHSRSGDVRRIEAALGCEVDFGAEADEVVFGSEIIDLPLVSHDPFLNRLMVKECEAALASRSPRPSPIRVMVENAIGPLLPHKKPSLEAVAKQLGMSERTLARRLAGEGLNFGDILDEPTAAACYSLSGGGRAPNIPDHVAVGFQPSKRTQPCLPSLARENAHAVQTCG